MASRNIRIGNAEILFDRRLIRRQGEEFSLPPKVIHVLETLANTPRRAVSREELLDAVWGYAGSDDSLSNAVWRLRNALGDHDDNAKIIETIPKYGYRLTVDPVKQSSRTSDNKPASRRFLGLSAVATALVIAVTTVWTMTGSPPQDPVIFTPRSLIPMAGAELSPAFDRQGQRIAYVSPRDTYHTDLYIYHRESGESVQLTSDPAWNFHPAWNNRGTDLAVYRYLDGYCQILIFDAHTHEEKQQLNCDDNAGRSLSWSADSSELLFAKTLNNRYNAVALDPATGQYRVVIEPQTRRGDIAPIQAPDGSRFAIIRLLDNQREAIVLTDDPTELKVIHQQIGAMVWSADSRTIYFSAKSGEERYSLWQWQPDGNQQPSLLTVLDGRNTQLAIDPVSGKLAYDMTRFDTDLWLVGPAARPDAVRLGTTLSMEQQPVINADGDELIFLTNDPATGTLWHRDLASGITRHLDYIQMPVHSADWVSDRHLVISARNIDSHDLFIVDLEIRSVSALLATPAEEIVPQASSDSEFVYFTANTDQNWRGYRLDRMTGEVVPVTGSGVSVVKPTPDNNTIYFSKLNAFGLWRKAIGNQDAELIATDMNSMDWGNWIVDQQGIGYLRRGSGRADMIWLDHTLTLQSEQRLDASVAEGASLSTSDNRQLMVMTRRNQFESDILILQDFHEMLASSF